MSNTFNDEKYEFLKKATGLDGTIDDLEVIWLLAQLTTPPAPPTDATVDDLWDLLLTELGYPPSLGGIQDRWTAWLQGDFGYTGTLNDMFLQYYTDWEVTGWLLTDVDGNQIKDVDGNFVLVLAI